MVAIVWELCMEGLWRGWHFAMIYRDEEIIKYIRMRYIYYHTTVMHVFCLPLAGFVIPNAIDYNLILNMVHKICMLISSS